MREWITETKNLPECRSSPEKQVYLGNYIHDMDLLRLFTLYTCKMGLHYNMMIMLMMIIERHGDVDQALFLFRKKAVYGYDSLTRSGQQGVQARACRLAQTKAAWAPSYLECPFWFR